MEINQYLNLWQQVVCDKISDHLAHASARSAGEDPIEIQAVQRRRATSDLQRRKIEIWHHNHSPGDLCRLQMTRKVVENNRPLVFVAVNGPGQQNGRTWCAVDHDDWDRHHAVSRLV